MCAVASALLAGLPAAAQEALRQSLAGDAAAETQHQAMMSQPWNIKKGDFKLIATPSLGLSWNDNINISRYQPLEDFILGPRLSLNAAYPLTTVNLLSASVDAGYDKYFEHDNYSGLRVDSGSAVAFDIYVKDFKIDLHDRFDVSQNSAGQPNVANTGPNGAVENAAGTSVNWDLEDVVLTLGYDHQNYNPIASALSYEASATESTLGRSAFQLSPTLTVGVEGTVSFTTYEQRVLNDNQGYSGGVYGDWRPGAALSLSPRAGYATYLFQQTSRVIRAQNENSWYADLTLTHAVTSWLSYSFSVGHELRLGLQADSTQSTYVRPALNWNLIKDLSLSTSFSYEHGTQTASSLIGSGSEAYDVTSGTLGLTYALLKKMSLGLNYHLTIRASNFAPREYTQNLVSLSLTYQP